MTVATLVGCFVFAGYAIGWFFSSRVALQLWMEQYKCSGNNNSYAHICRRYHKAHCLQTRGAIRSRTFLDATYASLIGLAWPALCLPLLILRKTPPTRAETDRRNAEQDLAIEKLDQRIQLMESTFDADTVFGRKP